MSDLSVGKPSVTPTFSRGWERDAEPVRATIRRVRKSRAHGFFAMPVGQSKPWFSQDQRALMCLLAVDPTVRNFDIRPVTFRLAIDFEQIDHTPDFRVDRQGERAIVDIVRPANPDKEPQRAQIAQAMEQECWARGYRYCRIEPAQIRTNPRYSNAVEILRFKSVQPSEEFNFRAIDALSRTGGVATIGMLVGALGGDPIPELYALSLRRVVLLEMDQPLSARTRVHLLAQGSK